MIGPKDLYNIEFSSQQIPIPIIIDQVGNPMINLPSGDDTYNILKHVIPDSGTICG